jgi:hypothetical protein
MATNNETTGTNTNNSQDCIVLKIDVFKTKFAADAAEHPIDKMVSEKAAAVEASSDDVITVKQPEITDFGVAVEFLKSVPGTEFVVLVQYAKKHNNKFLSCIKELRGCINADDAYCSALIELARPLGEQVENRAMSLLNAAVENPYPYYTNEVEKFFEALKVINSYC